MNYISDYYRRQSAFCLDIYFIVKISSGKCLWRCSF